MARIIGFNTEEIPEHKGYCTKCGAILIFNRAELSIYDSYNNYSGFTHTPIFGYGCCPCCDNRVQINITKKLWQE